MTDRDQRANHEEVVAMTEPASSIPAADLMNYLTEQRKHVLGILENLPEKAMRRPVLPTGWTCAGLIQHLALDVERFWFRQVMTGEQVEQDEFGDNGWQVRSEVSAAAVLGLYRREIELADKIITATSLEAPPPGGRTSSRPPFTWTTCGKFCCT
jgi:hypothetical protein